MEPLLSQRVRDAARTLEDMSRHYQFRNPREARWSAAELETEAPALEEEEREADDIEKGPIARAKIPVRLRFGLHGNWADGADLGALAA